MRRHTGARVFGVSQLDARLEVGKVGHWLGGGSGLSWRDLSGYQNDAVFTGAPTWTLGGPNGDRSAVKIVPATDLLNCGSAAVLDDLGSMTLAAWVYTTTLAAEQQIISKLTNTASAGWVWVIDQTTGALNFFRQHSGGSGQGFVTNQAVAINTWTHVAFTQASTGVAGTHYLNGVVCTLFSSAVGAALTADAAANLTIGSRELDALGLNGIIDDVRYYNRVLSASEVALLASPAFFPVVASGRRAYRAAATDTGEWMCRTVAVRSPRVVQVGY